MAPPRASVASAALAITAVLAIGRLAAFVSMLPGSWPKPRALRAGDVGSLPLAAGRTSAPHAAGALVLEQLVACGAAGLMFGASVAAARSRRAGRPQNVVAQPPDGRLVSLQAFNPASQVGATAPLGYWDPCGFCTNKDEDNFLKLRGIELKHGRVAMIALLGFWAEHAWHFPGFKAVPNGLAALTTFPGSVGIAFVFLIAGILELGPLPDLERGNAPGNFGDPGNLVDNKPIGGYEDNWRNFEINHGRIAMFGAIGTITANWYTGKDAFEQWEAAGPVAVDLIKRTIWWAP